MTVRYRPSSAALVSLLLACSGGSGGPAEPTDTGTDAVTDAGADTPSDSAPDTVDQDPDTVETDAPDATDATADPDAAVDVTDEDVDTSPLPELVTVARFEPPTDPLAGSDVESCAVYLETRCEAGTLQRCGVYDPAAEGFVEDPDPLLRRALLFDRWRDLYTSPAGQAIDRDFQGGDMMPGTPEEEWTSMERFRCYCGTGDGGIWTGWATVAAVLRYTQTGTEADYQRMEQQVRDLLTMYDVTGVPGYLSRFHYLHMPAGAPLTDTIIQRFEGDEGPSHHRRVIPDPESIDNLPVEYTAGVVDEEGEVWMGTPMWQGRPSIDQNTGPMTALPMAYDLLRDAALKERIAHHLTCYLKRLQRVEIINLQANEEFLETLIAYFSAGELLLEPGDVDLTGLDRIVGYVQIQINSRNETRRDWSCPDSVQLEPFRVIDATGPTFLLDMLDFIGDMNTSDERPETFDHYYFPSLRGGDAVHLMHLAAMAYHFTGDEQYRRFLFEELVDEVGTLDVANVAGAVQLPPFCRTYYGDQITYGPWWAFIELLGEGPLRRALEQAFHDEIWSKHLNETANVDLAIMYAGALPAEVATDREAALALVDELLPLMGGNGGVLMGEPFATRWMDDPKRVYSRSAADVLEAAGEGVEPRCPSAPEIAACTADIEYAGVRLPGLASETYTCGGGEHECPVDDAGQCMTWRTNRALPPPLRLSTDFLWQRDPFALGEAAGTEGWRQFSGTDYSEPYWNARRYGILSEGAGQVLAWESAGSCD